MVEGQVFLPGSNTAKLPVGNAFNQAMHDFFDLVARKMQFQTRLSATGFGYASEHSHPATVRDRRPDHIGLVYRNAEIQYYKVRFAWSVSLIKKTCPGEFQIIEIGHSDV